MTGRPARSAARELRTAVVLCVVGAGLVLLSTSRDWLRVQLPEAKPLPPAVEHLAGAALLPGARPLALVGLAGVAALFAARRSGRILVGLLVLLAGAAVVALTARLLVDSTGAVRRVERQRAVGLQPTGAVHLGPWPWLCLAGGLLVTAAGLLVMVRGRRWATLSTAYDAPSATSSTSSTTASAPTPAATTSSATSSAATLAGSSAATLAGSSAANLAGSSAAAPPASTSAAAPPATASLNPALSPEPPTARTADPPAVTTDRDAWDALDRGEDPTG